VEKQEYKWRGSMGGKQLCIEYWDCELNASWETELIKRIMNAMNKVMWYMHRKTGSSSMKWRWAQIWIKLNLNVLKMGKGNGLRKELLGAENL
jgi:hypothetical protein